MCRVTENLGLVHIIIRRHFSKTQYDYEDLFQEGCVGLVKAAEKFNPELGFQFSTYAGKLIWGEIRRYIRDEGTLLSKQRADYINYTKYVAATKKYGFDDYELLSNETGLTVNQIKDLERLSNNYLSLTYESFEDGYTLEEVISDGYNLEEDVLFKLDLEHKLNQLTIEERQLVELRYIQEKSQSEIGKLLGMNQVQVSRKLSKLNCKKDKCVRNTNGVQKVYEMFDKGCSDSNVCETMGVNPNTVRVYRSRWRKEVEYGGREAI